MKEIALTPYINCLGYTPNMRIGILGDKIDGLVTYERGDLVLFTPCQRDNNLSEKENALRVQECTIEKPSPWYDGERGSIPTIGCIVGVPISIISHEIIISPTTN